MWRTLVTTLELCTWSLLLAGVCSQGCGGTAIEPDDEYAYDFEVGAQGWTAEGGNNVASVSRAQAQHGEQSLEVVTDLDSADDWWSVAIVRDPATLPKAGDLISGWVWVPEDAGGPPAIAGPPAAAPHENANDLARGDDGRELALRRAGVTP